MNKYQYKPKPIFNAYVNSFRKDVNEYSIGRHAGENICVEMTMFNINYNSFINLKN